MKTMTTAATTEHNTQRNAIVPTDIKETDIKTDNEITEMKLVDESIPWDVRRMRKEESGGELKGCRQMMVVCLTKRRMVLW